MRIVLFIFLLSGTCLLHCNGQIDDLRDKISNIFRGVEFVAPSGTPQKIQENFEAEIQTRKNEISKIISSIDKNALETWCAQKDARYLHPVVEIIFSPFYSGVNSPENYVAYTKRAIQLATEIIDIIKQKNPHMFETTDCIVQDINKKITDQNTLDVFDKITFLKEKEQLLKDMYSGLEQLVQQMPKQVWHYRVSKRSNNPFEKCANNLQTQVHYIYFIKAIIQTKSQETLNDERYFNYTGDILDNININDHALENYPDYLKVTAETVDAILQKQPDLMNDSHIEHWPIYAIADALAEIEGALDITQSMREGIYAILDVLYKHDKQQFTTAEPGAEKAPREISTIINEYCQNKDEQHKSITNVSNELRELYRHMQYLTQRMQGLR